MEDVLIMEMRRGLDNKVVSRQFIDYFKSCLSISVNRKKDYLSGGYPEQFFNELWNLCDGDNLRKDAKILVVNDYALECVYELLRREFTNITILVTHDRVMHTVLDCLNRYYKLPVSIKIIELPEVCKMNEKFDLMIANPPYSCGNAVINKCLPFCKQAVVLMPGSCYKQKELFKHVRRINTTDSSIFKSDAASVVDVTVALLDTNVRDISYDNDFILYRYDKEIIPFVKQNQMAKLQYTKVLPGGDNLDLTTLNIETNFVLSARVLDDGVHTNPLSIDYQFNLLRKIPEKHTYGCGVIKFPSSNCKNNFSNFWYKNPTMNILLCGAHSSGVRTEINNLIPRIDWSVDRDYEHLTLDDLINILNEENN